MVVLPKHKSKADDEWGSRGKGFRKADALADDNSRFREHG
jgi:hypothetical protein